MLPDVQISDHLDIGKDESDEDKVNALSAVHSVGDPLWVKVRHLECTLVSPVASSLASLLTSE